MCFSPVWLAATGDSGCAGNSNVAGSAQAFLEQGETQGLQQCLGLGCVWVPLGKALIGGKTKDLGNMFHLCNGKKKNCVSTFFLCSRRNTWTWNKGNPGRSWFHPFTLFLAGCTLCSLSYHARGILASSPLLWTSSFLQGQVQVLSFPYPYLFLSCMQGSSITVFTIIYSHLKERLWVFYLTTVLKMA